MALSVTYRFLDFRISAVGLIGITSYVAWWSSFTWILFLSFTFDNVTTIFLGVCIFGWFCFSCSRLPVSACSCLIQDLGKFLFLNFFKFLVRGTNVICFICTVLRVKLYFPPSPPSLIHSHSSSSFHSFSFNFSVRNFQFTL